MFLEDERAAARLRARRVSLSFLIAASVVAASTMMACGVISTARAEGTPQLQRTEQTTGSVTAPVPAAAEATTLPAASAKPPRMTTHADGQIMRGLSMLLFALTAAGALAVWRRRIKRLMTTRTR
ncbi:hypothetical protein AM571_CH02691 [Rhizobium etli 8C-3]|uniref:Ca-activated chloride channel family protein n=2 Tax=Rhizobium TaxID=379 RepID=A0A4R3QSW5_9HYPH|nr:MULTISPECIES: hypothetical protein [Rhizobium]APO75496.1 hypothetical protein AM571_CH02691 [Rhizobium etli 8C-3]TCU25413.1 hypothetical protein EV130_10565 [Rhizobium azibense]TCU40300.1 hypothetical protein EV129_102443 [Rhizobium azibense]